MVYFGFVSNFETRPRSFFGVFGLFNFVEKALGTRLPLGVPMGTNGILSFLRIWLMIIEICEYERHLIFRRDSSLVQLVTFSILPCFFFFNMASQRPSISNHRLFPNHSSPKSTSAGPATSREDGNAPAFRAWFRRSTLTEIRWLFNVFQDVGGHKVKGRTIARLE